MKRAALMGVAVAGALGAWLWWPEPDHSAPALVPVGVAPVSVLPAPADLPVRPVALEAPDAGAVVAIAPAEKPIEVAGAVVIVDAGAVVVDAGVAAAPRTELAVMVEDAGAAPTAPPKMSDPRFGVRWGRPGLCAEEVDNRRAAVLAAMVPTPAGDAVVYHAGAVLPGLLQEITVSMIDSRRLAAGLVDWSTAAPHPLIYLYDSLDDLRSVSCVNQQAIAYYDGAIHLAANEDTDLFEVRATLHHEYIHHVLLKQGIVRPMWLHEGLAMYAAQEDWWKDPRLGLRTWVRSSHLPFPSMTYAFPHTSDRLFALAAYFQSELMVTFIIHEHGVDHLRVMVRALAQKQVTPEDAFFWGVGLSPAATEQRWAQFIAGQ